MGKEAILLIVLLFSVILLSSGILTQDAPNSEEYSQEYGGFEKFKDNIRLFFSKGDSKVQIALEIREKEITSVIGDIKEGNREDAVKNLNSAYDKLKIVQKGVSSDGAEEVKLNIEEIKKKILESKDIDENFVAYIDKYLTEEEKTRLSAELSEKLFDYCNEIARQDYEAMLKDEKCNPENAPSWLRSKINEKMEEGKKQAAEEMIKQLTTCINDPRECDCSNIPIVSERQKCETSKALAIRCEFQNDESACKQLDSMKPEIPSNLPFFLKPIFEKTMQDLIAKKEKEMFNKFAPKECKEAGATTREDCEKIMMEKYSPRECIEAGAKTKEDCEKIMIAKYGPPPTECMENGEFIGEEACNEKMIKSGKIPQECVKDGKPIPQEECEQKMLPQECKEAGATTREECESIMMEKMKDMIPKECIIDDRPVSQEECTRIMKEKGIMPKEGMPEGIPKECIIDGKPLPPEDCEKIMRELGIQPPEGMPPEGEMLSGECREMGITDFEACQEIVNLPRPCKDKGIYTRAECENEIMKEHMPKECIEANALTPEACMKIMLPQECKDANAFSREECEAIMIKKNMPQECQDKNALSPEECSKILAEKTEIEVSPGSEIEFLQKKGMSFEQIPGVCKSGSNFVRSMECDEALAILGMQLPAPLDISTIPQECLKDGQPISPQECQQILGEKLVNENIPGPCRENGITNPDDCAKFMESQRREEGIGVNMPKECFGKTPEECKVIMEEKGIQPVQPLQPPVEKICKEGEPCEQPPQPQPQEPKEMPQECVALGISDSSSCNIIMSKINEERMKNGDSMVVDTEGNQEYISNEQIDYIAEQAEKNAQEIKPDLAQAQEIKEEIVVIEGNIQQIEQQQQEIQLPPLPPPAAPEAPPAPPEAPPAPPEAPPAPPSPPEAPPATGQAIISIQKYNLIDKFFDFLNDLLF